MSKGDRWAHALRAIKDGAGRMPGGGFVVPVVSRCELGIRVAVQGDEGGLLFDVADARWLRDYLCSMFGLPAGSPPPQKPKRDHHKQKV